MAGRSRTEAAALKIPSPPLILLAIAAFLAPIIGGQIQLEPASLEPGFVPFLVAAFGGLGAPSVAHLLLGLLVLGSLFWSLCSRYVLQAPTIRVGAPLVGFFGLLAFSVSLSNFGMVSLASLAEWLVYGAAFFAVILSSGRVAGPRMLISSLFAGCVFVALWGILEYSSRPPDWRIFASWQHPNVLAGMLTIGLMLGLGLTATYERVAALAAGAGTGAIAFALVLTQSKGGVLAAAFGVLVLFYLLARRVPGKSLARAAAPLIVAAALVGALTFRSAADGGSPLGRVASAGQTQEQSAGVRINLWKTSLALIKGNGAGYGLNTFQFYSAKPGLVMSGVQLAHNSFLQIAVEAGPLALIMFAGFAIILLWELLRSSRKMPPENAALRSGVVAALLASGAHSMFDSDLYHIGIGVAFFLLCAIGLQLSADGVIPELAPKPTRLLVAAMAGVACLLLIYTETVGILKARINGDIALKDFEGAKSGVEALTALAPLDGEARYMGYRLASTQSEAMDSLQAAIRLRPATKYIRALAGMQFEAGRPKVALSTLESVFYWDPNNLPARYMRLKILDRLGDKEGARVAAKWLAGSINQPFFKTRALPEQVPLEPYRANVYLADRTTNTADEIARLRAAVQGFRDYALHIERNVQIGIEPLEGARSSLAEAKNLADRLAALYRRRPGRDDQTWAEGAAADFAKGLELLNKLAIEP